MGGAAALLVLAMLNKGGRTDSGAVLPSSVLVLQQPALDAGCVKYFGGPTRIGVNYCSDAVALDTGGITGAGLGSAAGVVGILGSGKAGGSPVLIGPPVSTDYASANLGIGEYGADPVLLPMAPWVASHQNALPWGKYNAV